jgi:hypothetical protein
VARVTGWLAVAAIVLAALVPLLHRLRLGRRADLRSRSVSSHVALGLAAFGASFVHPLTSVLALGSAGAMSGGDLGLALGGLAFVVLVAHTGLGLRLRDAEAQGARRRARAAHADGAHHRGLGRGAHDRGAAGALMCAYRTRAADELDDDVAALARACAALEATLEPGALAIVRACLAHELTDVERARARVDALEARGERASTAALEAMTELHRALGELVERAPELEYELRALPWGEPPELEPRVGKVCVATSNVDPSTGRAGVMSKLRGLLGAVASDVRPSPSGKVTAHATFEGHPVSVACDARSGLDTMTDTLLFATWLPRGTGRLSVRPSGFFDSVARLFSARTEIELEDPAFDPLFAVEGDPRTARGLLSRDVRRALVALARVDVPRLTVDEGHVLLEVTSDLRTSPVLGGLRVLMHLRRQRPVFRLVRGRAR